MNSRPHLDVLGQLAFLAVLRDRYGITLDYESILERDYRRLLKPGDVVADVGAHRGRHTTVFASLVGPAGTVLAFEPLPSESLELRHLVSGLAQVRVHEVALADEQGERDFVFASGTPSESGLRQRAFNLPDVANPSTIRVQVGRLDDYAKGLDRLSLVKIDIEGGEIDCLRGGRATLARLRPVVSVEYGAASYAAYGHERATLFALASEMGYAVSDLFGNVVAAPELWDKVCDNVYWDYLLFPREVLDECVLAIKSA